MPGRVVEWAVGGRGLPGVLVKAVMSLCEGAGARVGVGSGLSGRFSVGVSVHQGSVLSPLLFAVVVDEMAGGAGRGWMGQILCADELVLVGEAVERLGGSFDG